MGTEIVLVSVLFLFALSVIVAFLINLKMQKKRRKHINNNILQLNKFTKSICAAKDECDSGLSVEKIVQDLDSKDIL